jgi:DNA polymerase I-like protein with 3'-5' exonuclease and polymerase domains
VIVEVAPARRPRSSRLTEEALTGAADLSVPLKVSLALGPSWAAAKG